MTALWLRDIDSNWGVGRKLLTLTRSSTAAVTSTTNTITSSAAGGISPTDVAGGQALAWWFRVGADCTFAGQVTARMRGFESNAAANCGWSIQLDLCTVSAVLASIIPQTNLPAGGAASEMSSVADAATNLSSIQIPTPVTVHAGDFIRLYVRIVPVGTMASGFNVKMSYDGPTTGAVGDTWVIITDAFTDYQPEVLQAQLPGPPKATITGTAKNQGAWANSPIASVLTSTISGTNNVQGVLAAPVATVLTGSIVGTQTVQAVTAATFRPLTASITGTVVNPGVLSATTRVLTGGATDILIPQIAQSGVGDAGAVNGTNQVTILGSTLTKGSVILAALSVANQTATSTITDDAGLVWNVVPGSAFYANLGLQQVLYWARNNTTNPQLSVSVTWSATAAKRCVQLVEVINVDPTDATILDSFAPAMMSSGTTQPNSGSMLPTTPGDFLLSFIGSTQIPTPRAANGTIINTNTAGTVAIASRIVVGAPISTLSWQTSATSASMVLGVVLRPAGVHTPRYRQTGPAYTGGTGTLVSPPSGWQVGDKALIWLHLTWPGATFYQSTDVTVAGFAQVGWAFGSVQDNSSSGALWAGWRDLQPGDTTFAVTVPGAGASVEAYIELLAFDGGSPVGSPWGPGGLSTANSMYWGGQIVPPGKSPASNWALNTIQVWSSQGPVDLNGTNPSTLYWHNRIAGQYGNYSYDAPSHDSGLVTPVVNPPSTSPALALFGQVENGAPAMQGALVAQLPSLTGTLLEVQGIPAVLTARLPLATSALTAAQAVVGTLADQLPLMRTTLSATTANVGVLSAQVASVLTTAQTATQVNAGLLPGQMPLLRGAVADQGTAVIAAALPLLSGSLTATMVDAGVTASPKLPLLTNQTTAANINQAVLSGTLPHPLTMQTTVSQSNTGSTISFLPFPLLTSAITGAVVGQAGIAARLPLLTGAVVGLAAGAGTVNPTLPLLTWQGVVTQTNQGSVSGQIGSAVTTTGLTGTLLNQAVTTAKLPLLTAFVSDAIPGTVAGTVPLLTAAMTGTLVTLSGSISGSLPSLVGTLIGTPIIGGDLTAAVLPLLVTELTGDFFIHGTVHVPLPLLRTHLRGDSLGAVYLDVTVSAAPTRQGGMRVGSGDTHTLTLAGAAGTRADTVAAGDMRVGLTAGATREERGPR